MSSYTLDISGSEKAFQYFKYVKETDEEVFSSKAADAFKVKQPRAAKVLSDLEDYGVLKSQKQGRKRVYSYSEEGLIEVFWNLVTENIMYTQSLQEESVQNLMRKHFLNLGSEFEYSENPDKYSTVEAAVDKISEDIKEEFNPFLQRYTEEYIIRINSPTFEKMLIEDLFKGLMEVKKYELGEVPEEFQILYEIRKLFYLPLENPGSIVLKSLMSLENRDEDEKEKKE